MAIGREIREVDGRALRELLSGTDMLVVAEFYMDGCPACRAMAPVLDDIARELSEGAVFVRIDARDNLEIALHYGVVATPTFLLFCRGRFLAEMIGAVHPTILRDTICDLMESCHECAGR